MRRFDLLLTVLVIARCAWGQGVPDLGMEAACTPVKTARVFRTGFGPNTGGGWNFICQCMNYMSTGNKEKVTINLDTGEHYLAYADTSIRPEAEWVIVDIEAGTHKIVNLPGFHSAGAGRGGVLAGNGRVFFSVDYGHIYYYDPHDETINIMGRVHDSLTILRQFYRFELGPDGLIYGASQSTSGVACVFRLNPDTLEWKLITGVGLPGRRVLTYGYYIGVEPPWLYVAVGQGKWELCAVNFDSGEKRLLARRDGDDSRVVVSQGGDFCTAELHGTPERLNLALRAGRIVGEAKPGQPFQTPSTEPAQPDSTGLNAAPSDAADENEFVPPKPKTYPPLEWKESKPVSARVPPPELDLSRRVAISGQGEGVLYWRPAGAEEWRESRFTVQNTEPAAIESLNLLPDGSLLGSTQQYHGWFRYYPATKRCDHFGKGGPSGAKAVVFNGKVYYHGYPNCNMSVYDPDRPWQTENNANPMDAGSNPMLIGYFGQGVTEAHHARDIAALPNGRIYLLGHRERWSTGAGLGYYEIASDRKFGLGEAMKGLEPSSMALLPQIGRLVVSGHPTKGGNADGKYAAGFRVFDLELNAIDVVPLRDQVADTGTIQNVGLADTFLGWVDQEETSSIYLYSAPKQRVACWVDLAKKVSGRAFRRATDGTWWLIVGRTLCRLDIESLKLRTVGTLSRSISLPIWCGRELYAADGGVILRLNLNGME
ncbi:MAG: hypothetical protein H8E44_36910 [Planctomycetes bacterium]|nr:hypothetical protein [Planctomycetota bacterium]MBL7038590.1 hypothetical protein [Pirellulaceae bacterium]